MKSKSLSLLVFGILSMLVLTAFASAQIALTATDTEFSQATGDTLTVHIAGITAGNTVNFTFSQVKDYSGTEITFTPNPLTITADGDVVISTTIPSAFDFFGDSYSTVLTATEKNGADIVGTVVTKDLTFAPTLFCAWDGNDYDNLDDDLDVSIEGISVINGFGDDEEWYPMDEVEVEVEVKNRNSDDNIDNIKIEWGLFNKETGKWTIDVIDENDFDLKDGDSETKILSFKVDDLDENLEDLGSGDFVFYVRATGDVDNTDNDVACASDSKNVNIVADDNFVIVNNVEITEESVSCGNEIQVTADVLNLGDEEEESVYVIIYNKELGINKKVTLGDIEEFDNTELNAVIAIPENAEEKEYTLELTVYDEEGDIYENKNDDKSRTTFLLTVEGSCSITPKASISATLESESALAGKEVTIKAIVTNTGTKTATYSLNAAGFAEWASLASIDKKSLIIDAGKSEEVLITLSINNDASGEQDFSIELVEGNKILTQPVKVTVEKSSLFPNITGMFSGIAGDNWYLWGIGALNVLLVLIIIIVAMKVAKKKEE
ncbi:MAG: putative S-layer protein [Candidatus Pacearchaeota archaeon]|nr:putative S-layer protein [Candidatus Pacearchaeota archaeon]